MLTDRFFNASRKYTTKVDLTESEIAAINEMGQTLGLGQSLARTFNAMISNARWALDQTWGYDIEGIRVNTHESTVECSLYEPMEKGGFQRAPKIRFAYWENKDDGKKDIILDVTFIPSHLTGHDAKFSGMAPSILVLKDAKLEDIKCEQSKTVIAALRKPTLNLQPGT